MTTKHDVNKVFASEASPTDAPEFTGYEQGWGVSRDNNGKPTIKQFNFLQNITDEKIKWIHEHGGALPFDSSISYEDGAVVVKNGALCQLHGDEWKTLAGKDSDIVTWSGRTQEEKNRDTFSVEDFGVKTSNSAQQNNDAFFELEKSIKGQIIDLKGKTYFTLGDFNKNKYVNGSFYVNYNEIYGKGLQTVSSYKFNVGNGVAVGKFVAIHPDGDVSATSAHTGIQGFAFDAEQNVMYAQTSYSGTGTSELSRIVKFERIGSYPSINNKAIESKPTNVIGHQNLALTKDKNGKNFFWSIAGSAKGKDRALYLVRFNFNEDSKEIENHEFIKVFDEDNWVSDAARVVNTSPCGKWLVAFNARKTDNAWFCRVFKVSDLEDASIDHSNDFMYEFQITKQDRPVQGIAIDNQGVYILHGGGTYTNTNPFNYVYGTIEVRALDGTLIGLDKENKLCRQTAKEVNEEHNTTQYYEDEALGFVPTGLGEWKLGLMAITGRVGGHLYNSLVICDSASTVFAVGTKTKPAISLTGYAKLTFPNYGSGLEFQVQYASASASTVATLDSSGTFTHAIHNLRRKGTPYTRCVNLNASTTPPKSAINIYSLQPAVVGSDGSDAIAGAFQYWQDTTGGFYSRWLVNTVANKTVSVFLDSTNASFKLQGCSLVANTNETVGSKTSPIGANLKNLNISGVQVFADNASAKSGGLGPGDVYRTSSGQLMIVF